MKKTVRYMHSLNLPNIFGNTNHKKSVTSINIFLPHMCWLRKVYNSVILAYIVGMVK